ncbi:hypothetical protein LMG26689_00211 [Achromobacter animicus]|nr:hypothetical protein LMG26689_00211 [Achromobacter animicus]
MTMAFEFTACGTQAPFLLSLLYSAGSGPAS